MSVKGGDLNFTEKTVRFINPYKMTGYCYNNFYYKCRKFNDCITVDVEFVIIQGYYNNGSFIRSHEFYTIAVKINEDFSWFDTATSGNGVIIPSKYYYDINEAFIQSGLVRVNINILSFDSLFQQISPYICDNIHIQRFSTGNIYYSVIRILETCCRFFNKKTRNFLIWKYDINRNDIHLPLKRKSSFETSSIPIALSAQKFQRNFVGALPAKQGNRTLNHYSDNERKYEEISLPVKRKSSFETLQEDSQQRKRIRTDKYQNNFSEENRKESKSLQTKIIEKKISDNPERCIQNNLENTLNINNFPAFSKKDETGNNYENDSIINNSEVLQKKSKICNDPEILIIHDENNTIMDSDQEKLRSVTQEIESSKNDNNTQELSQILNDYLKMIEDQLRIFNATRQIKNAEISYSNNKINLSLL